MRYHGELGVLQHPPPASLRNRIKPSPQSAQKLYKEVTMASALKQAKRAKRAKTKAKQARTIRSTTPKVADEMSVEELQEMQEVLEEIKQMEAAEAVSQTEMLTMLLRDKEISAGKSLEEEINAQILALMVYGRRVGKPENWMRTPEFLEAYTAAARRMDREDLIDAWINATDF